MQRQKTFFKKTRRGKILKIVREHYLREDIACGFESCQHCDHQGSIGSGFTLLDSNPVSHSDKFRQNHYLVLDSNVILHQIDLIEAWPGLSNVLILQTVLEEVRHRSTPIFKRLKDVISDKKRKFFIFINEHRKETFLERNPGETANDRNDRAIRNSIKWYKEEHLVSSNNINNLDVILITNDVENRRKAGQENITSSSVVEYVKSLKKDLSILIDKVNLESEDGDNEPKKFLFPEHFSANEVNSGIKSKKLLRGIFYLSRTNFLEATVNCEFLDQAVLIQGLENQNRAVDRDQVAIEVFKKKKWASSAEIIAEDDGDDPGDTLEDDKILEKAVKSKDVQPTGRVVGIVKRKWRPYCGILEPSLIKGARRHIFVPAEKKIPKIRIETRQIEQLKGQRVIVAIDSWPRHSRYPNGHFVRALGKIGDKATENEVLLLEHDIPHSKFSESVLECLPKLPWKITTEDESKRVDCRHLDICSVDPPGCTDIDDALHCIELSNGNFEVGVHIADVSHFIRPETAIDQEAANRSTTVYLTDRRIDMVPELLSSNLCSLRGGVERFAFSCVWEMTPKADIVSTKFHKSIIKSRLAMTYEAAQNKIDDPEDNGNIAKSLRNLMKLSKIMKKRRMDNGALVLASSEVRFYVDSETADPIDVQAKVVRDTNSMVEEFMLAANISSAKKIYEEFPDCAMLRRHPAPPPSNFDPLVKAGKIQGFDINLDSGKTLAESLNLAVSKENQFFNTMLRMIATRCMMQAVYFASGTIEEPLFVHYGLACPIYTHFTSPIRRYADIIVHRLLAVTIGADATYPDLLNKIKCQNIANNINYRHRMAQYASRASVNLHTHIFFRNRKRDEIGYILFVRQNAIQVLIPKYGLEGTLFLRQDNVKFEFNETVPSQKCKGVTLKLFQKVKVQLTLDTSNVQHEKLILKLVEPKIEGFSVAPIDSNGAEVQVGQKRALESLEVVESAKKKKIKKKK